jgi:hypothetical protein
MLLNAVVQPMQQPARIVGFLDKCRQVPSITKAYFRSVSEDYHRFVTRLAAAQRVQIVEPPKGVRREDWVEPYYQRLGTRFGIAVILKSRENARIAVSYPTASGGNRIEVYTRFVWQYYFYVRDQDWGRMFLRICPYFPFNARICVNQHEWLARRLQEEGIFFRKAANAFVHCSNPDRLQQLANGLTPSDLEVPLQGWLRELVPFYASDDPHRLTDFAYRLFCSQIEYSTNLIFKQRAALDRLADRLLDLNRSIGRPDKLSTIFGHRITRAYRSFAASTKTAPSNNMCVTTSCCAMRPPATTHATWASANPFAICPSSAASCTASMTATLPSNKMCWRPTSTAAS